MKKAIIELGFTKYILDTDKAMKMLELLESAELYEETLVKNGSDRGEVSYHIYDQDPRDAIRQLKLVPMGFYNVARMSGKPEKK
jgi:hypothetical protein